LQTVTATDELTVN